MRRIEYSSAFRRDYRRMKKRGQRSTALMMSSRFSRTIRRFRHAVARIVSPGVWNGFRECHIGPDWLLVYDLEGDALALHRTGTHADLFE